MTAARSALDDVSFCHLVIIGVTDVTSPTAGSRRLLLRCLRVKGQSSPEDVACGCLVCLGAMRASLADEIRLA